MHPSNTSIKQPSPITHRPSPPASLHGHPSHPAPRRSNPALGAAHPTRAGSVTSAIRAGSSRRRPVETEPGAVRGAALGTSEVRNEPSTTSIVKYPFGLSPRPHPRSRAWPERCVAGRIRHQSVVVQRYPVPSCIEPSRPEHTDAACDVPARPTLLLHRHHLQSIQTIPLPPTRARLQRRRLIAQCPPATPRGPRFPAGLALTRHPDPSTAIVTPR